MFPIFKISGNFPLVNARFIRRVRGVLRGFLNLLKSLFEMLKGPLLLLFLSVLMYVIISSSEVKSNLNDCSIGFVRKSSYVFCVGIIPFSICFGILQKKWLNIFAICFFSVINFPLLLMFLICWVAFLLTLIISLIPPQTLISLFLLSSKKVCSDLLHLV